MKQILEFLKSLADNNNREWFADNKDKYLYIKSRCEDVAANLILSVAEYAPDAAKLSVADCTYRIYRDTRFSPDKTPYKTHFGIFVNPPFGKKSPTAGYYLHIEPGKCMFAAGNICHPSPVLKAIRQAIYDNTDEYIGIVESPEFKQYFKTVGENPLKTAPKGFPKDWEFADYIKPRDFIACVRLSDTEICSGRIGDILRPIIAQSKRFNDFMNYTIEDFVIME